jgi:predicted phosphodiesterase/GTPase SAR1 family protein
MRILHLSDIHFSNDNLIDFNRYFKKAFLIDIEEFNRDKQIDFVVITGDILDKGGASFESPLYGYMLFEEEFVEPLCKALSLDKQDIIFIPGNHDVDVSKINKYMESGIQNELNSIDSINKFVHENSSVDKQGIARMADFHEYKKTFYNGSGNNHLSCFESVFIRDYDGKKIGFGAVNTSWRCSPELPKDKLVVGTSQVFNIDDKLSQEKTQFNIILLHHPLELISELERHELNNIIHEKDFNLLMCGHTHETKVEGVSGANGNIFYSIAKSAFNNPREEIDRYKSGYIILDVNIDDNEITTYFRKYIHNRFAFDMDVDICKNGTFSTKLAHRNSRKGFLELISIKNKTCDIFKEDVNQSLLTFGTDSIAPKEITKLFVLPSITDSPETIGEINEEKKHFNLQDLLRTDDNYLLIGEKELGKTTLLNRLFIEASNDFPKYQKIPVLLNLKKFDNKDVLRHIRDFIHESSERTKELIDQGRILLLIDDFEPFNGTEHAMNKVKRFLSEFSNVKFIGTTNTAWDLFLSHEPTLFSESGGISNPLKPLFIGKVGVKEFKKLANNWFNENNSEWFNENIGRLIKVFEAIRIPRTFFSMSIYLWIIEKQESFNPINKFELVKRFINHILEGLKIDNAKAGSYDYSKKIELLSELSLKMYYNGDKENSYALKESKVIEVFEDNFKLNQLKFSPSEKLQEFIDKGIIARLEGIENNYTFRFSAFFSYFISYNIDKNTAFKDEVFSEEYFLSFIDEIDYYTGSKRDEKEALVFVMDKLKGAFKNIDEIISDNFDSLIPNKCVLLKHINTEDIIKEAKESKLSDEEIEEVFGESMELLPVDKSIKAKEKAKDYKRQFSNTLELASKVLKNSENIKDPDYVNESLDVIINKTAKYGFYINSVIIKEIEANFKNFPLPPEMLLFMTPLMNQLMLLSWLGTDFLEVPITNKATRLLNNAKAKEYELYLTVFLYSDLKFHNHITFLKKAIDKISNKFILELCFLKIFLYYMMRPEGSSLLEPFEKLMQKIVIKARGVSKESAKDMIENNIRQKKFGDHIEELE